MELDKYLEQGDKLIESLNERLEKQVAKDEQKLLDKVVGEFVDKLQKDENGKILNNDYNRRLLLTIDKVFQEYKQKQSEQIISIIVRGAMEILDFNTNYFSIMDGKAKLKKITPEVKDTLKVWLGIKGDKVEPNGYLDKLVESGEARNVIKNSALKMVIGQQGFQSAKKEMLKIIAGDEENLGALRKYHRNFTYDLFSQVDRAVGNQIGDYLGHRYAIYAGDIIKTSRQFCIDHCGNVYHKSEIEKFNPKVAKQPNYNPFTDLGGYGCRHQLRWISYAMAKRLRPEIVDLFENKNDSLRSKEEAEKILDDLPKGTIFDDAKRIETIFKKSNHSWSEVRGTLDKNKDAGKITEIDLDKIEITQPNIQSNKVKKMLSNTKELPLIDVVQFADGTYAIPDGHHRLTTGYLLGEKKNKGQFDKRVVIKKNITFVKYSKNFCYYENL